MAEREQACDAEDQVITQGVEGEDEYLDGESLDEFGDPTSIDKDSCRRSAIQQADDEG